MGLGVEFIIFLTNGEALSLSTSTGVIEGFSTFWIDLSSAVRL